MKTTDAEKYLIVNIGNNNRSTMNANSMDNNNRLEKRIIELEFYASMLQNQLRIKDILIRKLLDER